MSDMVTILLVLGGLIILGLAAYATHLLLLLKKQKQQEEVEQTRRQQEMDHHNKKQLNSIKIIVDAMLEEQCDVSEGCWRLSVLMGNLKMPEHDFEKEFSAVFDLYYRIKHMPILEARKALDKKERMKLDFERMKHEAELQDRIKEDITLLKSKTSTLLDALSS